MGHLKCDQILWLITITGDHIKQILLYIIYESDKNQDSVVEFYYFVEKNFDKYFLAHLENKKIHLKR